jgi:sulfide dehydrogenase cytochrome subunit
MHTIVSAFRPSGWAATGLAVALTGALAACSGGSSGISSGHSTPAVSLSSRAATFNGNDVEGPAIRSVSPIGLTGRNGNFSHVQGDTVNLSVGPIPTGQYTRIADPTPSQLRESVVVASSKKKNDGGSGSGATGPVTQPANTSGRLLASNCYQCHGTLGLGGFDNIRGKDADEVLDYLKKPASSDIMAAHAQGFTRAQLQQIINYLQQ